MAQSQRNALFIYFLFLVLQLCQCEGCSKAHYFTEQLIDHHNTKDSIGTTHVKAKKTWKQRYYISDKYFKRPGPIFLILGGEEAITPEDGILYPFVSEHLAKDFSGLVIELEHRFYGASQPLKDTDHVTNDALSQLMTPEQAILDAVKFVEYIKSRYHCTSTSPVGKHKKTFCPVIAVGGSYPGFLAAMMRFLHPTIIDAAYSASAPMEFYAQTVEQWSYYDHVTKVADESSPGCADSVKTALLHIIDVIAQEVVTLEDAASRMGICFLPSFMADKTSFVNEIMMIVGYTFADYNMAYYPPNNSTKLYQACQLFQDGSISFFDQMNLFFQPYHTVSNVESDLSSCFDVTTQLPDGPNATISSGDWSGVGTKWNGNMWDFQTCSLLIEKIGFSKQSMFPPRTWTLEWLTDHCWRRFQVNPEPDFLVNKWGFDKSHLVENGASRILFTNGLNDGWSVSGIQTNLSSSVLSLNFENGAHHSDLTREGPTEYDTDDIKEGFIKIRDILKSFIESATFVGIEDQEDEIAII